MAYHNISTRPGGNVMDFAPRDFADFVAKTTLKDQTLRQLYEAKSTMGLPSPVQSPYAQLAQAMQGDAGPVGSAPKASYGNAPKWGQAAPPEAVTPFTPPSEAAPSETSAPTGSRSERMLQQMREKSTAPPGGFGTIAPSRGVSPEEEEEMRRQERIRKLLGR